MGELVGNTDFRAVLRSVGYGLIDRIADGLSQADVAAAAESLIAQKIPALVALGQKTDAGTAAFEQNVQKTAIVEQKTGPEPETSPEILLEKTADADPYKNDLPISMDDNGRIYWRGVSTSVILKRERKNLFRDFLYSGGRMAIPVKNREVGDTFDALERDIKAARAFATNINRDLRAAAEILVEVAVTSVTYEIFLRDRILVN